MRVQPYYVGVVKPRMATTGVELGVEHFVDVSDIH
jgi:hypothetical protein